MTASNWLLKLNNMSNKLNTNALGGGISLLERRRAMMAMGEDYSSWVKVVFRRSSSGVQNIVESNTGRVPDEALNASRIIVDGVEITPTRAVQMEAGEHEVLYNIGNGMGASWWYWVANAISVEFPANITSLSATSIVFATSPTPIMTFHGEYPFTGTFPDYITQRQIFVKEQYKQQYIDGGFTNITTF